MSQHICCPPVFRVADDFRSFWELDGIRDRFPLRELFVIIGPKVLQNDIVGNLLVRLLELVHRVLYHRLLGV